MGDIVNLVKNKEEVDNEMIVKHLNENSLPDKKIDFDKKIDINTKTNVNEIFYMDKKIIKMYSLSSHITSLMSNLNDYIKLNDSSFIIFYLKPVNTPIFIKGEKYIKDNKEYIISNIDDAISYLKDNKNIKIASLEDGEVLTIKNNNRLNLHKNIIDRPNETIIMDLISEYITSYFMTTDHIESHIVLSDVFNISDDFLLCNNSAIIYENFKDFISSKLVITDETLINLLDDLFINIYEYITSIIDIESTKSLNIKLQNNIVKLTFSESPSSKRYFLNTYYKDRYEVL